MKKIKEFFNCNVFFATYGTTIKTLFRSILFWMAAVVVFCLIMHCAMKINRSYVVVEDGQIIETIYDTDPRYKLEYKTVINVIFNLQAWLTTYALPVFAVISTLIIVLRNHADGFFEIEKASNVSTFSYLGGRLCALITVNTVMCLICAFASFYYYYYSRGGMAGSTFINVVKYLNPRVLRQVFYDLMPGLIFYIVFTYAVGTIAKKGVVGGIVGMLYVLFNYLSCTTLRMKLPKVYHDFLSPFSDGIQGWWGHYNTEWFYEKSYHNPFTINDMYLAYGIIFGAILFYIAISFILTKRRTR